MSGSDAIQWVNQIKNQAAAAVLLNQSVVQNCNLLLSLLEPEGIDKEDNTEKIVAAAVAKRRKFIAKKLAS